MRPQASGLRPQASGLRPQASGLRPQASGFRPQRRFAPDVFVLLRRWCPIALVVQRMFVPECP
ncbi:hypothetical protein ACIA8K_38645 [Catenuloplanes sp. NPDC051500]|uniref:hypothetical protein n=1 Tax=Catenuloplanes sp. NPDC051500 TaxID=3363959 RepID=UPI0037A6BF49